MMYYTNTERQKDFEKTFFDLCDRWEPSRVFDDFLTIVVCCLARETQEPLYFQTIEKYSKEELNHFAKLMARLFECYSEPDGWTDPLGLLYEEITSSFKSSGLGQFFTPPTLCDMMTKFISPEPVENRISDPACGSGRTLLSALCENFNATFVAQDLDNMCCKMTAINFALHGKTGVVYNANTLTNSKPYRIYLVNQYFKETGIATIFLPDVPEPSPTPQPKPKTIQQKLF